MPNIAGYAETGDPNWIQVQFDDGSSIHAQDPTGTYRKEVDDIAAKFAAPQGLTTEQQYQNAVGRLAGGANAPQVMARGALPESSPYAGAVAGVGGGDQPPMPVTAPITPAEAAPLQPSPADLAALNGQPPAAPPPAAPATPPGSLVSDAERASLTANPADLAGLRRGLGEATHAPGTVAPAPAPGGPAGPAATRTPYGARVPAMGMAGASVGTTGLSDADRAKVDEARGAAIADADAARRAKLEADTARVNAEWDSLNQQGKEKLAEEAQLKQQEEAFTARLAANHQKLTEDLNRKVDPGQAFKGDAQYYAFMAGLGDSLQNFGAALAGRGPVANPGETINRIINRNVELQTQQKEQDFRRGRITAEELTSERETVRARLLTVGKQRIENNLAKEKNLDSRAQLMAAGKFIDAERSDAIAKQAEASARHETRQENFAPLQTGGPPSNATIEALKLLGVTPEQYSKGMAHPLGNEKNSPSVNDTVTSIAEMDQDIETLKALKAANGNVLPTTGAIKVPQFMRNKMAQLGIRSGMQAEEANALINTYLTRKAKSYGGVITESDRESAALEFGKTGEGFLRGISRMRAGSQRSLRQGIDTIFPGVGQQVLDLSMRRAAQTPGIPEAEGIEDFEVQSAEQKAHDVSVTRESPEGRARRLERERKHLADKPDAWKDFRGVEPLEQKDEDGNPVIDLDELEQKVGR